MKRKINYTVLTPVIMFLALTIFGVMDLEAAPGDLDRAFGNGGLVATNIAGSPAEPFEHYASSILVQPDGKIVVCGVYYDTAANYTPQGFLVRYHPTGALDTAFGTNGLVLVQPASDLAVQPDGKIIAVGGYYLVGGVGAFGVVRFNPDGTDDTSFGSGGLVLTPIGDPSNQASGTTGVAIQPDGKIVVVGQTWLNQGPHAWSAAVRYNPNGSLDTSFGNGGKVLTSFGQYLSKPDEVAVQADGKIILVGTAYVHNNPLSSVVLARFDPDGSLDSGFGTGGKVFEGVSSGYRTIHDALLQPDGKIIVASIRDNGIGESSYLIIRYNINGSIDTSFATSGVFSAVNSYLNGIALQPDGKILSFGNALPGFAIQRLNPNGTPDANFGNNGRVVSQFATSSFASVGAVKPDGKILAVGGIFTPNGIELAIARYRGDSVVQRAAQFDFDGDRRADLGVFRATDRTWYLDRSTNGFSATQFGLSTDKITPADYDGDGKTDFSVFRDGIWYWIDSSNGTFRAAQFGLASDIPVTADFTGDGRAELAIYRSGTWWSLDRTNNQTSVVQFGLASDKPVVADYDGDGRADQAVYRNGEWHLNRSTQGYIAFQFGLAADRPAIGDYDGDGETDLAVYRDGVWYVLQSSNGMSVFQFGIASDTPAPADYDGDGKTDAAVYRDGLWYLLQSTSGFAVQQFGLPEDKPIAAAFLH